MNFDSRNQNLKERHFATRDKPYLYTGHKYSGRKYFYSMCGGGQTERGSTIHIHLLLIKETDHNICAQCTLGNSSAQAGPF